MSAGADAGDLAAAAAAAAAPDPGAPDPGADDPAWTDREGRPVTVPEPPAPAGSCYRAIGDFQADGYERNAFAQGTDAEVAWLRQRLEVGPGARVVDVGCGTGRHARALAAAVGAEVVAVDVSAGLLTAGRDREPVRAGGGDGRVAWLQADARHLPLRPGCADVVLSLCQGGFGLGPGDDEAVLAEMARVLGDGGRLVVTAFSLAFAARYLAPEDSVDALRGLVHSPAEVRDAEGHRRSFDLWTACYTPRHLVRLLADAGLRIDAITGAEPGAFTDRAPRITDPEFIVQASR